MRKRKILTPEEGVRNALAMLYAYFDGLRMVCALYKVQVHEMRGILACWHPGYERDVVRRMVRSAGGVGSGGWHLLSGIRSAVAGGYVNRFKRAGDNKRPRYYVELTGLGKMLAERFASYCGQRYAVHVKAMRSGGYTDISSAFPRGSVPPEVIPGSGLPLP